MATLIFFIPGFIALMLGIGLLYDHFLWHSHLHGSIAYARRIFII